MIPQRQFRVNHAVAPSIAPRTAPSKMPITTLFIERCPPWAEILSPFTLLYNVRGNSFKHLAKCFKELRGLGGGTHGQCLAITRRTIRISKYAKINRIATLCFFQNRRSVSNAVSFLALTDKPSR